MRSKMGIRALTWLLVLLLAAPAGLGAQQPVQEQGIGPAQNYTYSQVIGGFALVAYPARYASSGIMTFIVNQDGVVYEKDLGKNTEKAAEAMTSFDPDRTWMKVE
ncbi:MAG TPA: DUF2950 family protein [Syntrophorhabdales bacterium]|nr:DUF2950 family protein [Syntrophorhabdales bacterium]